MLASYSEAEFHQACKDLEARARKLGLDIKHFTGDVSFLRITRALIPYKSQTDFPCDEELESVIEQPEENVVYAKADTPSEIVVEYDVMYSPSYAVPVLYFRVKHKQIVQNSLDFVYENLVPSSRSAELQSVGILGGLSQINHPALDHPCFFVHPCKSSEAMEALLADRSVSAREYLQIWIGLIGSAVGLSLPVVLAA